MSRSSAPDHVHVGRDGWLFLVGGPNRPISLYRSSLRSDWVRSRALRGWDRLVRDRAARARTLGCRYLHVLVPEKLTVYPEQTGLDYDPGRSLGRGIAARLADPDLCVDLARPLLAAKEHGPVFLKTDSHWTSAGCRVAHDAVCGWAGAAIGWTLADRPVLTFETEGDLGERFSPPRRETQRRVVVERHGRRVFANALLAHHEASRQGHILHRGANVVLRNDSAGADPRRLVVFGDSCAHFVDYMLTGMLAESFREVHFVWSAAIDWGYVERTRPDLLVSEIAERFTPRVPRDDFDLESFAAAKLAGAPP